MKYVAPISIEQMAALEASSQSQADTARLNQRVDEENYARQLADRAIREEIYALSDTYSLKVANLESSDTAIMAALSSETALREAAIASLEETITEISTAQGTSEINVVNKINAAVGNESEARSEAIGRLERTLRAVIESETALRETADDNLESVIGSETAIRASENAALNARIDGEIETRATEIANLHTQLESEIGYRIETDAELIRRLDAALNSTTTIWDGALANVQDTLAQIQSDYAPINSPTFTGIVKVPAIDAGAASDTAVNKLYVDNKLSGIGEGLNVFTSPTATTPGVRGLVGDCEPGLDLKIWTNFGWRKPDDTQLTVTTLPSQKGTLIYTGDVLSPEWNNYDTSKFLITFTPESEVGTYTAKVKPIDLYVWSDTLDQREKDITWIIEPSLLKEEDSTGFVQTGKTYYTGEPRTPQIARYNPAYHVLDSDSSAIEPGVYTLTIRPKGAFQWYDGTTTPKSVQWELEPQPVAVPSATTSQFNYSGSTVNFVPNYAPNETSAIAISSDSKKAESALGTYAVKYTLKNPAGKTYYVWADDGSTRTITLTWKIVTNVLSTDLSSGFAQAAPMTFNGAMREVVITHASATLHTVTGNTASDAGTYTASIVPVYGYAWNGNTPAPSPCTEAKTVSWKIDPIYSAKPKLSQDYWDYTGSSVNAANKITGGYNVDLVEFGVNASDVLSASEPGSYTITARLKNPAGKSNYQWTGGGTGDVPMTWRIGAKLIAMPKISGTTGDTYTLQSNRIVIEGPEFDYASNTTRTISVDNYVLTYMESTGTLSATNANTYEVVYTLKDSNVTLWNATINGTQGSNLPVVIRWKIKPILLSAAQSTFSASGEYYYNQSEQTVTISGYNPSYHEISGNKGTNATNYTARISPKQNYAFNDGTTAAKGVGWTIQPAQVRVDVAVDTSTWKISPVVSYKADKYDFSSTTYFRYTVIKGKATVGFRGTTEGTNVGTGTCYADAPNAVFVYGGVTGGSTITISWTINRANLNSTQSAVGNATYTYGDAPANPIPNYNTTYHSGGITALPANAGTYNYTIYPTSNYAWNDGTTVGKTVTITVNPKAITKPSASQTEFTYDSDTTVNFLNSYIHYYDSTTMTAGSTLYAQNAGDYAITFALKSTTNYKWSDGSTATHQINWKIKPKTFTKPSARQSSFEYTGSQIDITNYLNNYDNTKMTISGNTRTDAGSSTAVVSIVNPRGLTNYTWTDGTTDTVSISWQITPKPLDKPYCKYNDTTIQWTGSEINWVEHAIEGYDSNTMTVTISGLETIEGRSLYYKKTTIGDNYFGIKPKNDNYMWRNTNANRAPVIFLWSIVRQRLLDDENGPNRGNFEVTNGTADFYVNKTAAFFYTANTSARPTATIPGYNPQKHTLYKQAEGGIAATTLVLPWTIGEHIWGIEPKGNYAWSDGTYGRKTFKIEIVKSVVSVEIIEGGNITKDGQLWNLGDIEWFTTSCQADITDSDTMSSATYNIGKTFKFRIVDYTGNAVMLSNSDVTLSTTDVDYVSLRDLMRDTNTKTYTQYVYGLGHGYFEIGIYTSETEYYFAAANINEYPAATIYGNVNRSLASVQTWAKIREICQAGKADLYARGDETYPVTLSGTVGTVNVSGNYLAQLVDWDGSRTVWAICKKSGVEGHIAFADSRYGTLVNDGTKAFAHITTTDTSTTDANSALVARANEFINTFSSPMKTVPIIDPYQDFSTKVYFAPNFGYFGANLAPFKHFTNTNTTVKLWSSIPNGGTTAEAYNFTGSSRTRESPDLHMSLGLVPIFTIG